MHTPQDPNHLPTRYRRRSPARLARSGWANGRSVWTVDDATRPTTVDHITVTTAPAPRHIATALNITPGAEAVTRRRRYLIDNTPIQYATSYYAATIAAGTRIAEANTGPGGTYARLAELGYAPAHFREELYVRPPEPAEAQVLALPDNVNVIDLVRTALTHDGTPVEVTELVLDSRAYVLEYTFSAD